MEIKTLGLAAVAAVFAATCPAQDPATLPTAKILKREVDGLIGTIRASAGADGSLGTCRETAMVLTAAGHSHRFYHAGDGPWLRRAIDSLFAHRRGDGLFAQGADDDAA